MSRSQHAEEALAYLNKVKPTDGWALDVFLNPKKANAKRVRILRRNVAISKDDFEDIALDTNSSCVIGIPKVSKLKKVNDWGNEKLKGEGMVLVEKNGTVSRNSKMISISLKPEPKISSEKTHAKVSTGNPTTGTIHRTRTTPAPGVRPRNTNAQANAPQINIDPRTQEQIMNYLIYAVLGIVALKILLTALASFLILFIPLFFFAQATCPPDNTFDAKKELKRVLRGVHLPEDHPDKPKSWLEKTMSRVTASVATELATGLGYELCLTHFFGLGTLAVVEVDVANVKCYWIGCFNKWFYIMQKEIN